MQDGAGKRGIGVTAAQSRSVIHGENGPSKREESPAGDSSSAQFRTITTGQLSVSRVGLNVAAASGFPVTGAPIAVSRGPAVRAFRALAWVQLRRSRADATASQ
jgi:hypothetical protein